jgi:hypothetical protein
MRPPRGLEVLLPKSGGRRRKQPSWRPLQSPWQGQLSSAARPLQGGQLPSPKAEATQPRKNSLVPLLLCFWVSFQAWRETTTSEERRWSEREDRRTVPTLPWQASGWPEFQPRKGRGLKRNHFLCFDYYLGIGKLDFFFVSMWQEVTDLPRLSRSMKNSAHTK